MNKRLPKTILLLCIFAVCLTDHIVVRGSSYAQDINFLSFGSGKTGVRLYTDYFCGPCSSLEPKIEQIVTELVKKNRISLTYVDTPFYRYSALYAQYFLYIMNEKKDLKHAAYSRSRLFEAAKAKIYEREKLEEFLHSKGIWFKPFDTKPVFRILEGYIKADKVHQTPTCVIYKDEKQESYAGAGDIMKALEGLQ